MFGEQDVDTTTSDPVAWYLVHTPLGLLMETEEGGWRVGETVII